MRRMCSGEEEGRRNKPELMSGNISKCKVVALSRCVPGYRASGSTKYAGSATPIHQRNLVVIVCQAYQPFPRLEKRMWVVVTAGPVAARLNKNRLTTTVVSWKMNLNAFRVAVYFMLRVYNKVE
ncbi:hypothetical protein TcasGA2_TC004660 [Tribolium castaneum]|uniref:Uncharacterized protein n=1 Tax=Tribolium castaneum TaxID=7070 RepID=D6W6G3_TRICA|nr:hypothetical protein TcasGA2_TC004660 [Tribolium castaneum]